MRHLLISAATFAMLAAPALAQPTDPSQIRGKGGFGQYLQQQQQQPQPQQAPQAPPQQQDRGQRQQAAPQQQQQAAPPDRGNRDAGRSQGGYRDYNRDGNRDYNRGGQDYRRDGRDDYRRGYDNRRRDYSGFRDYGRSYNSARRFRGPSYHRPNGWYDRRWAFGDFLPGLFWSSSYWLNDFDRYDLPPPPYGTVWVQNGRDALLVDRDSGEIISVRYSVFY